MACSDKVISYSDLKSLLDQDTPDLVLVDVRTPEEVAKGKIPGSINIPVESVKSAFSMDEDSFLTKYGIEKPPLDAPHLVFHCQLGRRGDSATETARALGFSSARNYAGGYKEWAERESH
ncbi:thiosulfate:glutathione sulfurtransferase [Erpetoichthys calabaricus]|uniref:Thiosulfate sulfurtransferase like domain containing 1 n=1 Tax=Erpetoichthys calabaricus TaxID=27687 RepID=A0A8C4X315_ERPCA|nr:thiosulfate:glutathione sulfurtransferase [Erpetoichthys calabaricus]